MISQPVRRNAIEWVKNSNNTKHHLLSSYYAPAILHILLGVLSTTLQRPFLISGWGRAFCQESHGLRAVEPRLESALQGSSTGSGAGPGYAGEKIKKIGRRRARGKHPLWITQVRTRPGGLWRTSQKRARN